MHIQPTEDRKTVCHTNQGSDEVEKYSESDSEKGNKISKISLANNSAKASACNSSDEENDDNENDEEGDEDSDDDVDENENSRLEAFAG